MLKIRRECQVEGKKLLTPLVRILTVVGLKAIDQKNQPLVDLVRHFFVETIDQELQEQEQISLRLKWSYVPLNNGTSFMCAVCGGEILSYFVLCAAKCTNTCIKCVDKITRQKCTKYGCDHKKYKHCITFHNHLLLLIKKLQYPLVHMLKCEYLMTTK